jgi:hypothetical protein
MAVGARGDVRSPSALVVGCISPAAPPLMIRDISFRSGSNRYVGGKLTSLAREVGALALLPASYCVLTRKRAVFCGPIVFHFASRSEQLIYNELEDLKYSSIDRALDAHASKVAA